MSDLISRDSLRMQFAKECHGECDVCVERCQESGECMLVVAAPAVEAAPVIHARWVNNYGTRCSSCGERLPVIRYTQGTYDGPQDVVEEIDPTPYCPNCGAKMDLREGLL